MSNKLIYYFVQKSFGKRKILDDFKLFLHSGSRIILVGDSGSGKTTILNCLSGLTKVDFGFASFNDKPIWFDALRPNVINYMPCGNSLIESLSVKDNLSFAGYAQDKINDMLTRLKIDHILESFPSEISSGEYRRVCFARTVLSDAPFLFFDEPTSNLDAQSAELILEVLNDDNLKDKGMIIATHDPRIIKIKGAKVIDV